MKTKPTLIEWDKLTENPKIRLMKPLEEFSHYIESEPLVVEPQEAEGYMSEQGWENTKILLGDLSRPFKLDRWNDKYHSPRLYCPICHSQQQQKVLKRLEEFKR